eukprot:TCONS_00002950-protein
MRSILFLVFIARFVYCKPPQFENPVIYEYEEDKVYSANGQSYNDEKPFGYLRAVLPHPPNHDRHNPVFELEDLQDRQIEMRLETSLSQKGATICIRDNDEGPDICSQGSINQCYMASKSKLKFEIYCMESCQSSDVELFVRFVPSKKNANDMWCTMRETGGYPSELIDGPPLAQIGKAPVTPAPRREGGDGTDSSGSHGRMIYPALTVMIGSLFVFFAL